MVPGTALGVLAGDLAYTWLAIRLMRRTGRRDVTAMPFGIDTPTLFAMVFGVLGPVMLATGDPVLAWKVGMAATVAIGLAKLGLAFGGDWARRIVPRAALLGSIAGISILLIAFLAGAQDHARSGWSASSPCWSCCWRSSGACGCRSGFRARSPRRSRAR